MKVVERIERFFSIVFIAAFILYGVFSIPLSVTAILAILRVVSLKTQLIVSSIAGIIGGAGILALIVCLICIKIQDTEN